jgi:hypothetical protein
MSGGAFGNIYGLDGQELLAEHDALENVGFMAKQLAGYGEPGQLAAARTQAALLKMQAYRAAMKKMAADIQAAAAELTEVWRVTELHASCDAREADVLAILQAHDENEDRVALAVELALADAIDDISTPLAETGKRWQFDPELSPDPVRRAQRLALDAAMSIREREDAVDRFHRGLQSVKYFASGRAVDNDFLLSIF